MAEPLGGIGGGELSASAGIASARTMAHGEVLARWGRSRPDKAAFICGERAVTYGEMDRRANAVAHALAGRGVAKGDRVAILMGNNLEHIEVLLGAFRMGAVAVPISFRLAPPEAAFVITDSGSSVLVVDDVFAPVAAAVRDLVPGPRSGPGQRRRPGRGRARGRVLRPGRGRRRRVAAGGLCHRARRRLHHVHLGDDGPAQRGAVSATSTCS